MAVGAGEGEEVGVGEGEGVGVAVGEEVWLVKMTSTQ